MKGHLVVLAAVGLILLLAACGSATPSPEAAATPSPEAAATTEEAVASPTATSTVMPTSAPKATEVIAESTTAFPTPNPNPECVAELIPEDPNIPPATDDEWSRGPDGALVTLVEYSDFQ